MAANITTILAEMRERAEKATPGWSAERGWAGSEHIAFIVRGEQDGIKFGFSGQDENDVLFAAHARTDLPRLVSALEAAVKWTEVLDEYTRRRVLDDIKARLEGK